MQGKKLTDAEILKWLEHCKNAGDCFPCPLSGTAYCIHSTTTAKVYYDFINRKQAEIELLYKVINQQDYAMKNAQAEAYKEFAELSIKRICEQVSAPTPSESYIVEKCNQVIYKLFKELVGEENVD